jgi:FtsH-binding integral membrane protein
MNTKLIYAIVVAVVISIIVIFYHDQISLEILIGTLLGLGGALMSVYQWITKEDIKTTFKEQSGMTVKQYKSTHKK